MKLSVYQFIIDGHKLDFKKGGKIDITGTLYTSVGSCPALEKYYGDSQIKSSVKYDTATSIGSFFNTKNDPPKGIHMPGYEHKNRLYITDLCEGKYPVLIELRKGSVWFRVFYCASCYGQLDLVKTFFDVETGQLSSLAKKAIITVNVNIALENFEVDYVKPIIY